MGRKLKKEKEKKLISVVVSDFPNPKLQYGSVPGVVTDKILDRVKVLAAKVLDIIPPEALAFYIGKKKPLLEFLILYKDDGEYTLATDGPEAILQIFDNDINQITDMLDRSLQSAH